MKKIPVYIEFGDRTLTAECSECGNKVRALGTSQRSINYAYVMLRDDCLHRGRFEQYFDETQLVSYKVPDWVIAIRDEIISDMYPAPEEWEALWTQ